jgi:hypothetical protein
MQWFEVPKIYDAKYDAVLRLFLHKPGRFGLRRLLFPWSDTLANKLLAANSDGLSRISESLKLVFRAPATPM